jgi:hypothetical protein
MTDFIDVRLDARELGAILAGLVAIKRGAHHALRRRDPLAWAMIATLRSISRFAGDELVEPLSAAEIDEVCMRLVDAARGGGPGADLANDR